MPSFRLAIAQLSPLTGDLSTNCTRILHARANATDADLLVTPLHALTGGPLQDLALKPGFQQATDAALKQLTEATNNNGPALLVGTLVDGTPGMALLDGGQVEALITESRLLHIRGQVIGLLTTPSPEDAARLKDEGAEMLLLADASHFTARARADRLAQAREITKTTGLPLCRINRTGAQDGLVFDGGSFALHADGALSDQLPWWDEATTTLNWENGISGPTTPDEDEMTALYHAMIIGLRHYVRANRFPGVVLGLSGGIDSALAAAVAVDALGPDKVWCILLPSRFTSEASLKDAADCARLMGTRFDSISITPAMAAMDEMLSPLFAGKDPDLAEENIQARLRMVALMGVSNKFRHMLLTTGNKSELAVGYSTIYGDLAGGYSVLKDAYKSEVFALSRWRNVHKPRLALGPDGPVMPERVITKPPSAELRDDQRDDDSLPPYDILDPILRGLIEEELSVCDLVTRGFEHDTVARIERLLYNGEYKRQQAPPGVRLSDKDFTYGRHYPTTNGFRTA